MTKAYNCDCMEYMKSLPDKAFDIAIVDPPYGSGKGNGENPDRFDGGRLFKRYKQESSVARTGGGWAEKCGKTIADWDIAPPPEYFKELFRVSKNQIIWGGNYFMLPPTRCFLVWRKQIPETFSMAMAEFAWTSFDANAKVYEHTSVGSKDDPRFHPTQKPVALYKWQMNLFCKPGDRILDTHLGSGSSRIAADELGFDFVGLEINKAYFDKQEERYKRFTDQLRLF